MPPRRRAAPLVLALAALGMALCSLPHALGAWPHFRAGLVALGADARLVGAIGSAWAFGTVMMLASGAIAVGVGSAAVQAGGSLMNAATHPIGTPLPVTEETISVIPPNRALQQPAAKN